MMQKQKTLGKFDVQKQGQHCHFGKMQSAIINHAHNYLLSVTDRTAPGIRMLNG